MDETVYIDQIGILEIVDIHKVIVLQRASSRTKNVLDKYVRMSERS
jgi:hypothetical protein